MRWSDEQIKTENAINKGNYSINILVLKNQTDGSIYIHQNQ